MWQGLAGKEQKIQILDPADPSVELPVQTHAQQPSFVYNNGAIFKIPMWRSQSSPKTPQMSGRIMGNFGWNYAQDNEVRRDGATVKSLGLGYKYLIQQKYQVALRSNRAKLNEICKQCVELMFPPSQLKNKSILMDRPEFKGLFYALYVNSMLYVIVV